MALGAGWTLITGGSVFGEQATAISYYDTDPADLKLAVSTNTNGTQWNAAVVTGANRTKGLYTNLHYIDNSGGFAHWDIIYYSREGGGRIERARNSAALVRTWNGTLWYWAGFAANDFTVLRTDGGAEVTVDWRNSTFSYAYALTDGTGLNIVRDQ